MDNAISNLFINSCNSMGHLFLGDFLGFNHFAFGFFMWMLLFAMVIGFMGTKGKARR